jgi:hypothetical protein|tara:strand:+ start:647 stop:1087 length:441 start_codon:yes stop_codon:yes gene_type:complete
MLTLFDILEGRTESGQGSKKGREKYSSKKGAKEKGAVTAKKSRVRIYATIAKALEQGKVGEIFSTKGSDRVYVVSKADWGEKSSGKIAKGFTPGSSTPSSDFHSVKAHAARTMLKHGTTKSSRLKKLYGPGAEDKIDNSKKAVAKR